MDLILEFVSPVGDSVTFKRAGCVHTQRSESTGRRMIMTARTAGKRFMTAAILGIVCLAFSPLTNVRAADEDSAQVSALLSQTKLEAIRLREDANQMKDFVRSIVAWDTHAAYSGLIADDIVAMLDKINQLDRARSSGSAWQQNAIDKIKPLMKELAATTEALAKAMLEK